jgi:hypothetical protein
MRLDAYQQMLMGIEAHLHAHIYADEHPLDRPGPVVPADIDDDWNGDYIDPNVWAATPEGEQLEVRGDGVRCVDSGMRDDTAEIQRAIDEGAAVVVPRGITNLQQEAMKAFSQAREKSKPKSKTKMTITQLPSEPPRRRLDDRTNLIADTEP